MKTFTSVSSRQLSNLITEIARYVLRKLAKKQSADITSAECVRRRLKKVSVRYAESELIMMKVPIVIARTRTRTIKLVHHQ